MKFSDVRALKTQIAEVASLVVKEGGDPQCVVVTHEQHRALVMVEGGYELRLAGRKLLVVSDLAVGSPLPDGQFQVLDRVPITKES